MFLTRFIPTTEGQPPQMHPLPRPVTAQPSSMDHTTAGYPGYTPAHPGYTPAPSVAQPPLMTPPQSYQQGPQGNEIVPSPPNMTTQPGWVPLIDSGSAGLPPNIPPGLEYLAELDQILIHQVVEILEGQRIWKCQYVSMSKVPAKRKERKSLYIKHANSKFSLKWKFWVTNFWIDL